jgi:hypothetical protein
MKKKTNSNALQTRNATSSAKSKQRFPAGWNEARVRAVIAHYDDLTDEERAAEIERASQDPSQTIMSIPIALVPAVLKLIRRHEKSA